MDICLKTFNNGKDGTALFKDDQFIGQIYVLPYLKHNPKLCLVALNNEKPAGYIVGTDNSQTFYKWAEKEFLPPVRELYPETFSCKTELECYFINRLHSDKSNDPIDTHFPAHFHINILPDLQGQGVGVELVQGFLELLKARDCPGIEIHVSKKNPNAFHFYLKNGFKILREDEASCKLGLKLTGKH